MYISQYLLDFEVYFDDTLPNCGIYATYACKMSCKLDTADMYCAGDSLKQQKSRRFVRACGDPVAGQIMLGPALRLVQRPSARPDGGERTQPGRICFPYTKHRCEHWSQNAAIAELVQNWKDEADDAAVRSGCSATDFKLCRMRRRYDGVVSVVVKSFDVRLPTTDEKPIMPLQS